MRRDHLEGMAHMASGPFKGNYRSNSNPIRPNSVNTSLFDTVRDFYEEALEHDYKFIFDGCEPNLITDCQILLTTREIQQIIACTQVYEHHSNYSVATGLFLTKLIQNAYDVSVEQLFTLDLRGIKPLDYLFSWLREKVDKPLTVRVIGEAGHFCAHRVRGGAYYIQKVGKYFGESASPSERFNENMGREPILCADIADSGCANWSSYARFYVRSGNGYLGSSSHYSKIYIKEIRDFDGLDRPLSKYFTVSTPQNHNHFDDYKNIVEFVSDSAWEEEWNRTMELFRGKP